MKRTRVIIMGAAGRDFHNFNICFRKNRDFQVLAFTAAQIPFITERRYPPSLAGKLYPRGIPIYDEAELPRLIRAKHVDQVVFAYSDISHVELMHKASMVMACGADFRLLGPDATMLKCRKPVISVCAVRTGAGKSQVSRYVAGIAADRGCKPVVVRHPMPYGQLKEQTAERFASMEDLERYNCTIEEREEYEPLIQSGSLVFAGVDYERILRAAEKEGDIIVWDGGNNDFPFFRPDLEITIVDPLRPGHETEYYPGEVNLRRAHIVVINKINTVDGDTVHSMEKRIHAVNPSAVVIKTASEIHVEEASSISGKSVLVVEDGPTVTHGGMPSGAGLAAALKFSASTVIDPRDFAVSSIREIYSSYPHLGPVLPAMGYSPKQIRDLQKTIERCPCEMVISATPIDLENIMEIDKPVKRVTYEIHEQKGQILKKVIEEFLDGHGC